MRSLGFIACLACAIFTWVNVLDYTAQFSVIGNDFVQDYAAGFAVRTGQPIYGENIGKIAATHHEGWKVTDFENFHPPLFALIAIPFTYVPIERAFIYWNVTLAILFPISLLMICRRIGISNLKSAVVMAIMPLLMPIISTLCLGQANALLLFLLVITWLLWRKPDKYSKNLAAIPLAIASLIKMFPAFLLIVFLLDKQWRAIMIFSATFVGGMLVCGAILGEESISAYIYHIAPRDVEKWAVFPINHSVQGMIRRALAPTKFTLPLHDAPSLIPILIFVITSLILMADFLFLWHMKKKAHLADTNDLLFWSQLVPMFLISPITWQHSLVLLIPLLLILSIQRKRIYRIMALVCVGGLSLLDIEIARRFVAQYPQGIPWQLSTLTINTPFFCLLILGAFLYLCDDIENRAI